MADGSGAASVKNTENLINSKLKMSPWLGKPKQLTWLQARPEDEESSSTLSCAGKANPAHLRSTLGFSLY